MFNSVERRSSRSRLLVLAIAAAVCATTVLASAEIIVDDFDIPAEVVEVATGSMPDIGVVTEHVGDLDSLRKISVFTIQTEPVFVFESSGLDNSVLHAELNGHQRKSTNSAIISFAIDYSFLSRDLTEGGINNAFLIDFASHHGTEPPQFLRITARDADLSLSYAAFLFQVPFGDSPFTTVIPFSDFALRGGGQAAPDFSTLHRVVVDFFFLNANDNIQWSAELNRIRIGVAPVPEPGLIWLLVGGFLVLVCSRSCQTFNPQYRRIVRCREH